MPRKNSKVSSDSFFRTFLEDKGTKVKRPKTQKRKHKATLESRPKSTKVTRSKSSTKMSKVGKLAQKYRKEGMSLSASMKQAWKDV